MLKYPLQLKRWLNKVQQKWLRMWLVWESRKIKHYRFIASDNKALNTLTKIDVKEKSYPRNV